MIKWICIVVRCVPSIVITWFTLKHMNRHKEKYTLEQRYTCARKAICKICKATRTHYVIDGEEILTKSHDSGRIYIGNHTSVFEVLSMIVYSEKPLIFISKIENKKIPVLRTFVEALDCLLINRKDVRQSLRICKEAGELCEKQKRDIVIYPEGTRSKDGNVHEFKAALASIIHYSHSETIMVCSYNTKQPLSWKWVSYPRVNVYIKVFEPITYDYYVENKKAINKIMQEKLQMQLEVYRKIEAKIK